MKIKMLVSLASAVTFLLAGLAEGAGTGTLKYTFQYKDPGTGVVTPLTNAFIYLRSASKPPPMEKYFSRADYINSVGAGDGSYADPNIPAGTWYIRITQRSTGNNANQYGPPMPGDYTWMQTATITIAAGQTLDLGTINAYPFGSSPITISGTVKNSSGAPLADRYVRAQTTPCYDDGYNGNINQCGPVKDLALRPTDANGSYMLQLRNPGTYYIYTSRCVSAVHNQYSGNVCTYTPAAGNPVTVNTGDTKTVNIVGY